MIPEPEDSLPPRQSPAGTHPCELYGYHAPRVCRTEYHHSHPQYLQVRLYGKVMEGPDMWVCSSCHDSIHEWLGWLLGESRHPDPAPSVRAQAAAQRSYDWYESLLPPKP